MKSSKLAKSRKRQYRVHYEVLKERAITGKSVTRSLWSVQRARKHEKSCGVVTMERSKRAQSRKKLWRGHYGAFKARVIMNKAVAWSLWSVQSARNHEKICSAVTMKCSKSAQSRKSGGVQVTKEFSQHQCGRLENEKILELDNPFDSIYHSVIMLIRSSDDLMTHSDVSVFNFNERVIHKHVIACRFECDYYAIYFSRIIQNAGD